jgi:hypothetical protein
MNLPMILGLVVISMVAGSLVTVFGYYAPFMILSAVLTSIGAGLITTFKAINQNGSDTSSSLVPDLGLVCNKSWSQFKLA